MNIQKELDRLEDMILSSPRIPFSGRTLIDENAVLDILDRIRMNLPKVIEEAERVVEQSETLLAQAQQEAERLVALAEQQAGRIVEESELLRVARVRAEDLKSQAQKEADSIQQSALQQAQLVQNGADQYAERVLGKLESDLSQLLQIVKNGRQSLQE
ncbi:hypothetical protein [Gloeobacter kilaueensis]|uniref:ATPase n=1 Tax=Gloeobacter kilaueensis (strain ATCC BAA-2537 / CCAP 1431/1 / ULC 316 / JS1) TaxID=1183438 RepID=U5QMW6_GLOK1|nr:hypothetical protein [Gloeobacter kilaueensis]AGY60266.1 hypothetical protein GKIL_4020 [Gloeobacter kilaueensis JS1]